MSSYGIGEVARRAGISASAIRYYEEVGLLPEPEREGGKRRYDESVLRRLTVVKSAKRAGFTVEEIHTLFHGFPGATASERWQRLASMKLEEVDETIVQLQNVRSLLKEALQCNCAGLDECAELLSHT